MQHKHWLFQHKTLPVCHLLHILSAVMICGGIIALKYFRKFTYNHRQFQISVNLTQNVNNLS